MIIIFINVSTRVCSVFGINDIGLHSAIQEDHCMFLSIGYISPHFNMNFGNDTNLTSFSSQFGCCTWSHHANVFTMAGLRSTFWKFWWPKPSDLWAESASCLCVLIGYVTATKSWATGLLYSSKTWTLLADSEKKNPGFRNQMHEETSQYLLLRAQDQWLGVEQNQLPCGSTGTSSGNCQEMETCMVWACHMPRMPLKNHHSGHLGGWVMPWLAEEILDGQYQGVDTLVHARTARKGLL